MERNLSQTHLLILEGLQKDRWCLLESLYPSDPDSNESLSEEDEDLERFFQDKGSEKPQVQYPSSAR